MKLPPMLLHVKVRGEENSFGLWLPFFMLLLMVLVVCIILSPLILIAVLVLWLSGWGKRALLVIKAAFEVFYSMRGLRIDIQNWHRNVYISVV